MDSAREKAVGFLKRKRMDPADVDIERCVGLFLSEMELGLEGGRSSLRMIPTFIDVKKEMPAGTSAVVLDAGGTNFRVAVVSFRADGRPVIERFSLKPMPGLGREVSKREFFETVADYLRETVGRADAGIGPTIGFCFSYPTEILPSRDGRLIHFDKEVKAKEVEGELIGEGLLTALRSRGCASFARVVVLNDTVATLLAGMAGTAGRVFDGYVGFILGTGTNCCYVEKNVNILKRHDLDPAGEQIVNVESGGFGKGPAGDIDIEFDEGTTDPGKQRFEKMISGAYFGPLCLKTIRTAAEEGLFSGAFSKAARREASLSTKDVNEFLLAPAPRPAAENAAAGTNPLAAIAALGTKEDLATLFHIVDRLIERAAKLTAVNISSVVLKSGRGRNPCFPVCVTAEGSTFHGLKGLRRRVECHLEDYLVETHERYYDIVSVEDATLIGAAIAGLTN